MILHEWERQENVFSGEQLLRFNAYLGTVWDSRERYLETEEADEPGNPVQRFFDFSFDGAITARNYVGVVQFEGQRITVKPKVFLGRGEELNWKYHLFFWLSHCRRIRFPFTMAELDTMDFDDFLELLIYIFSHYTQELVNAQPYQSYQTVEEESTYLRGRLLFDAYTNQNLITGRWQHFTCQYQPFILDNLFNRIIKYVTKRLLAVSRHQVNREKLGGILYALDEVSDVAVSAGDCQRVSLNALYGEHQQVLDLCAMYLSRQMIDTGGEDSTNFCFLLPMEYVFEDFMFGFLRSNFPEHDLRRQSPGYLARRGTETVFRIKNDLLIPGKMVLDTKYKFRPVADDLKAGVHQGDMYQMLAYALRRHCRKVVLIYPDFVNAENRPAQFQISSHLLGSEVLIEVFTVDLMIRDWSKATEILTGRLSGLFT